MIKPLFGQMDF